MAVLAPFLIIRPQIAEYGAGTRPSGEHPFVGGQSVLMAPVRAVCAGHLGQFLHGGNGLQRFGDGRAQLSMGVICVFLLTKSTFLFLRLGC